MVGRPHSEKSDREAIFKNHSGGDQAQGAYHDKDQSRFHRSYATLHTDRYGIMQLAGNLLELYKCAVARRCAVGLSVQLAQPNG